jgi:hypothetical protein
MAQREGLRVQLSPIRGLTKGKTLKLLRPYFRFQCPPLDTFERQHGHNFVRSNNYRGREYIRRGGKRLASIPFRTLIVEYANFVVEERWDLEHMRDTMAVIAEEGYTFRLLATHHYGERAEIDTHAVMESVTITENEPDARYLDFTFTEWDDARIDTRTNRRPGGKHFPFTITLRRNGTYFASHGATFKTHKEPLTWNVIAKYAYGSTRYATYLAHSQKPPMKNWGLHTPLIQSHRYKHGGKILVPEPPEAGISIGTFSTIPSIGDL